MPPQQRPCIELTASDIRVVAETASTNDDMKALAAEGAGEGLWLRAERQTAGRGRMGRDWEGQAGNLFASTLVRVTRLDPPPPTLALVVAVAVHRALEDFVGAGALTIKWPNDVMAGHAKLSGVLMERAGDAVVIGIGVNVATAPHIPGRRTACLHDLGAPACDAASVLEAIATCFAEELLRWRTYGLEPTVRAWLSRAHAPGTPMTVQLPDGETIIGAFDTLAPDGALILRLADGGIRAIHAGDVFLT